MRVACGRVWLRDVEHGVVLCDPGRYAGHVNRGGLWRFGGGELALAHLVRDVDYAAGDDVRKPYAHVYATGARSGVLLHRSRDGGRTWPPDERTWVWHNDRPLEEILDWLRPRPAAQREAIDLGHPDAIVHVSSLEYVRFPLGGTHLVGDERARPEHRDALFRLDDQPGFLMRSPDRGRTWERWPTLLRGEPPTGAFIAANLGSVRLDGGIGIAASSRGRNRPAFWVSRDCGLTWRRTGDIARVDTGDPGDGFTYLGVHRLGDGRLLCIGHRMPDNTPCASRSADEGRSWSPPEPIVDPAGLPAAPPPEPTPRPVGDEEGQPRYRSPCGCALRDGRVVVLYARRRYTGRADRGICGVLSQDGGTTWTEEFVLRGDQFAWDGGYPLLTELDDGTLFAAYYITTRDRVVGAHAGGVPEWACVRHVAWSRFRLA